ncbi:efflux RND transporter periplasmic adaptor subunit [Draconibacterium orientale]|uniref:efflux RND transporter periplasmic adaptor subunit n=1 Tax=Draconibacterium orientale TaxID=1168034 RepID=UPI002A0A7733|nr:efflux RND transporter periplasmic adaptor subunit [Draconibacterium orientale]
MHTNRKTILIVLSTLAIGLLLGWLIFGGSEAKVTEEHQHEHGAEEVAGETTWTCSMHPQIRQQEPGDCPICGMDLIPLEEEQNGEVDPNAVSMSATAMQLANIKTTIVGAVEPLKVVRLNGKVQEDERLIFSQSSHISGRIEDLLVNFTGDYVKKGQVIASVYSPDLVTAQEELFEAQKIKDTQPQLFEAAKAKLKNWKLTDEQINQILASETAQQTFEVEAEVSGYVTKKMVNTGDYVRRGQAIYEIADLSKVWILFDVYESDLTWINKGDKVSYTIESLPGETFEGTIDYLDPVINPKTRVAKARVVQSNNSLKLKPEMFVSGKVEAKLPQTDALVVPKTAVMWTGERSVVYVKSETGQGVYFNMREVDLGPALGESYVVENGVQQGEEIAVNGTFSIDAAAQLAGKPSMMSPASEKSEGFTLSETLTTTPMEVNPKFVKQLTAFYEAYLKMNEAFIATDAKKVSAEAKNTLNALSSVQMKLLKGDTHMDWMDQLNVLKPSLQKIGNSNDIDEQRLEYATFNQASYKSLKMFGLDNETAYYQFCPMANNDQGAYWFSAEKEIRNPYFGDMMLSCGENRDTIK